MVTRRYGNSQIKNTDRRLQWARVTRQIITIWSKDFGVNTALILLYMHEALYLALMHDPNASKTAKIDKNSISEATGISLSTVLRSLKKLEQERILISNRGSYMFTLESDGSSVLSKKFPKVKTLLNELFTE